MDTVMRKVIVATRNIVFASPERRSAAHGGLVSSIVGTLPLLSSKDDAGAYHVFDVVVTDGNPLLAAIVLHRAAKAGLTAAVVTSRSTDPWPYDLAATSEISTLAASACGLADEVSPVGDNPTSWLLQRLLSAIPRTFPVIDGSLAPSDRHPHGEIALYMSGWVPADPPASFTHQGTMAAIFDSFMQGRSEAAPARRCRTIVFARQIVLTARPSLFSKSTVEDGRIDWGSPRVLGLGTARWDAPDYREAAKLMMEDVLLAGRWMLPS